MARLMNLTARPQEDMAACYFENGKLFSINFDIMEKPDPQKIWSSKTTFKQLRRMTMVPRYAVLPDNQKKIWNLATLLSQEP